VAHARRLIWRIGLGADVLMLQEGQPAGLWIGKLAGMLVADRTWGSWIVVRAGVLDPISITGYTGWVSGARWRLGDSDEVTDPYLFSVPQWTVQKRQLIDSQNRQLLRAGETG